jgi:tetratricopeptide (TPR) repeat protein
VVFLLWGNISFSQPSTSKTANNYRLALQYLDQNEYDKANALFSDLFDQSPESIFINYYKSLLAAKDYSRAEKICRKMLKMDKQSVKYYVYLGHVYKMQEDVKKEKEAYDRAVRELVPSQSATQNLANTLLEFDLYDYALDAYNKAATRDYPYHYEKADVYKRKNDLKSMINEYLDALEFRESDITMVQTNLQNSLGYDDEEGGIKNPLLKQELQKRIQKNPDKIILCEFLVIIQKLQKDFEGAFVQTRALDKRLKEEGSRVYDLAKVCVSNQQWEVAQRCYEYIIEKGPVSMYYDGAMVDVLNVEYLALTQKAQPKKEDLLALEQKYKKAKEKYASTYLSALIIKNLALLQAYYLNKTDEAIQLLLELVNSSGLEAPSKAEYKIMLADIYLVKGEIWEASLLYSQVEKDFKYEAIGQEAKYKNARLSFYAGDFKWAKAQADVLKGATSKLIANDALDLSLIISDAIGVDTNEVPLQMFSSAELMILQHKYSEAIARMDSINSMFSNNTLGDDIYFKKAQIFKSLGKFAEAEAMYKNIIEYYPDGLYGDDSQFRLAELYERNLMDRDKAKQAYQDVLTKYPGSIFVVEARKRFRELRGDILTN